MRRLYVFSKWYCIFSIFLRVPINKQIGNLAINVTCQLCKFYKKKLLVLMGLFTVERGATTMKSISLLKSWRLFFILHHEAKWIRGQFEFPIWPRRLKLLNSQTWIPGLRTLKRTIARICRLYYIETLHTPRENNLNSHIFQVAQNEQHTASYFSFAFHFMLIFSLARALPSLRHSHTYTHTPG